MAVKTWTLVSHNLTCWHRRSEKEIDGFFLLTAHPLATGFQLTAGEVNVTVPDVVERDDYIIIRALSWMRMRPIR